MELLTAMGHTTNSSAATEEFVTVPGLSNTVNAANFTGATNEAKITTAIAHATANGKAYCLVPKSMLPYDPTLVTFSHADVQMVREGGFAPAGGFDIHAYGGKGNRGDDKNAWSAVIDAVKAKPNAPGIGGAAGRILLESGKCYTTSRPTLFPGYVAIVGPDRVSALLEASYGGGGPLLVSGSPSYVFPVGTSLATGSGSSFAPTSQVHWLELRDFTKLLDIDGTAALTVEAFVRFAGTDDGVVIQSGGHWTTHDAYHRAFYIGTSSGNWSWGITTGSGSIFRNTAIPFSANVTYHTAISYDGTTARLFIDGVQTDSSAQTGSIVQDISEAVVVGIVNSATPISSAVNYLSGGTGTRIDSIRVSNTARYTTGFTTPTAKFTNDGSTLILCNFDLQVGPMTRAYTKSGDCWLVVTDAASADTEAASYAEIHNVTFHGGGYASGIWLGPGNTYYITFRRLRFDGCRCSIVASPGADHYGGNWSEFNISSGSDARYGLVLSGNTGLLEVNNLFVSGCAIPLVVQTGGITVTSAFMGCQSDSHMGVLQQDIGNALSNTYNCLVISTEAGVNAGWRGAVFLSGPHNASTFNSAALETSGGKAPILIDGTGPLVFNSLYTHLAGPPASLVSRISGGPPVRPVIFNGTPYFNTGWIPLADQAGDAIVTGLGPKSVAFSATPSFDCSLAIEFADVTLTGNVTAANINNATPGQVISIKVVQDAGARTWVWGTVNGTGAVKGATAIDTGNAHWSLWVLGIDLDGNAYQRSFNSGT